MEDQQNIKKRRIPVSLTVGDYCADGLRFNVVGMDYEEVARNLTFNEVFEHPTWLITDIMTPLDVELANVPENIVSYSALKYALDDMAALRLEYGSLLTERYSAVGDRLVEIDGPYGLLREINRKLNVQRSIVRILFRLTTGHNFSEIQDWGL